MGVNLLKGLGLALVGHVGVLTFRIGQAPCFANCLHQGFTMLRNSIGLVVLVGSTKLGYCLRRPKKGPYAHGPSLQSFGVPRTSW